MLKIKSKGRAVIPCLGDIKGRMTGRMSLSFHSPITVEHEKNLVTGSLEQRKEAFKEDEELMKETTKFVTEIIETAASEASKRKFESEVIIRKIVALEKN